MTEHLLKILVVGDGEVGKSSFVHRYVSGHFSGTYKMTMGGRAAVANQHGAGWVCGYFTTGELFQHKARIIWQVMEVVLFMSFPLSGQRPALAC